MDDTPRGILTERLRSWRRGPYPRTTSFVSALSSSADGECQWLTDIHNIIDLHTLMEARLTYRQMDILCRYVVGGDAQADIAGDLDLSQQAVSIELETASMELIK